MTKDNAQATLAVVGGGVIGSAAAWALSRRGAKVTLLEQFEPGHRRGASHGSSRIFRHGGYEDQYHIGLAAKAFLSWRELERVSGRRLLTLTGGLDHGDPVALQRKADALAVAGLDHELIDPVQAARRWPGLRIDTAALVHPAAGRLQADRSVQALQEQAVRHGAEIRHQVRVTGIEDRADGVRIRTAGTGSPTVDVDAVVVAGGAWTTGLVGGRVPLPALRTTQEQPAHFVPLDPATPWPSFVHHPGAQWQAEGIYGLGSVDGVKIGEHATGPEVDPDHRDFLARADGVARLVDYARQWLPGVDASSAEPLTCLYTCTPDHLFLVDRVDRLTIGAGFSGHGFKFAPAIGDLLADLALGSVPSENPFTVERFTAAAARPGKD